MSRCTPAMLRSRLHCSVCSSRHEKDSIVYLRRCAAATINDDAEVFGKTRNLPMLRHFAQPFDAGILHGGIGVQPFGDGVGDDCLPLLFQQFNQPLLLLYQRIDLLKFSI